jgi:cytochrome c5
MRVPVILMSFALSTLTLADPVQVSAGEKLYNQTCVACHGPSGKGAIPGVADLTKSDGALAKSDDALFKSIKEGFQTPGAALTMPPNGGNPALTDDDIRALLVYLRSTFGSDAQGIGAN